MNYVLITQARMSSSRLPGKVMRLVQGIPLLNHHLRRLKKVQFAQTIVLATTCKEVDDVIAEVGTKERIVVVRGSEEDVLGRFYQAALRYQATHIVRVTSDCPLIDPEIIDAAIQFFQKGGADYQSIANFPRGMDVEICTMQALERAFIEAEKEAEREHVMPYLYSHPEKFRLSQYISPIEYPPYRLTLDTPEDFQLIELILNDIYPSCPNYRLFDVVNCLKAHPDWVLINQDISQKRWDDTTQ